MALVLALTIALLALATCVLFLVHPWWFPISISASASSIDRQFAVTFIVCGILFVVAQITMAGFVWRYRSSRPGVQAPAGHANGPYELFWTAVVTVLFVSLGAAGYRVWARTTVSPPAPGALRVEVWGEQFEWYFRYPGPDGQFGPIHPDLMNDGTGNYLGLEREHDAASRDDVVTATLTVPVGRPVELMVRSKDVIHSFFVRELRIKQDAIPGRISSIPFTADRMGRYEIVCSELCGLGHYKMHADLDVVTTEQFQQWLLRQAQSQ
ncbi:MAG TPA: cytochrome c oxidase subunit II [Terriglobia bacterium]|nr:cytochrome c oxidase subunit II [Terriglobia bacterium]